jgi:hypothetical protein
VIPKSKIPAARTVVLDSVLDPTRRNCLNRTVATSDAISCELTRSVGVFLPVQNLTDEFLISENNCRGGGSAQLFLEHFSCSAPMA